MNILIPMAGVGSRFTKAGYRTPKPFIDVCGKTMIERAVESIGTADHYIFVYDHGHGELYPAVFEKLERAAKKVTFIPVHRTTQGQACSCLLAAWYINTAESLLVANCDQIADYGTPGNLDVTANADNLDGIIMTFTSMDVKNSYVAVGADGLVTRTAEKTVISDRATCGLYYWRHGCDFVESANAMIAAEDRVNGEFYVCPAYNYLIRRGARIGARQVTQHHPLGTPDDLVSFCSKGCVALPQ